MGKRGPQAATIPLKILRGNSNGRDSGGRLIPTPPAFERCEPAMPPWLSGAARDEWERVVPALSALNLLKEGDGPLLTAYCLCWQTIVDTSAILAVEGYTEPGAKRQVAHSAVGIRNRAIADLRQLAVQFGLSPASESGLSAPMVPQDADDPFASVPSEYGT